MFQSFFPRPKLFLLSALAWVAVAVALWYTQGEAMGAWFGFLPTDPAAEPVLGLGHFVTPQFLWFYLYCAAFLAVFTAAWFILSPHPYQWWSIVGTAVILFSSTYLYKILGTRVLVALERLMGMLLVAISVQMLMDGIRAYLNSPA